MADYTQKDYSQTIGNAPTGVSINNDRRIFNFGDRVAKLAPQQSPFFVYLSKVANKPTDDPVFKFLEQRNQWQRRNFFVSTTSTASKWAPTITVAGASLVAGEDLYLSCSYNKYGKDTGVVENPCYFLLPGQVIALKDDAGNVVKMRIDPDATVSTQTGAYTDGDSSTAVVHCENAADLNTVITSESLIAITAVPAEDYTAVTSKGQVMGSAWAEASKSPEGWKDALSSSEGYAQIFKTSIPLFSNTALSTKYRGDNEYKRVWREKLMEHKMDIEHALLFGIGSAHGTNDLDSGAPVRYTDGILTYTEANGKVFTFTYADSGYDAFLDNMEVFFSPESGNSGSKLVLSSRKIINYLNKMGDNGFWKNTVGDGQYRLDVTNIPGNFGHTVTKVSTIFGDLHFIQEPLFRGPWENYAVAIDMANVAYRPLKGNGMSRDTHIITNIQDNDVDGRKDMVITEAGLEISLPETHAVLSFS